MEFLLYSVSHSLSANTRQFPAFPTGNGESVRHGLQQEEVGMTRPALLRQADLKRMAAVAIEHDVCVEVEIDGTIVRVMPTGKHRVIRRVLTREEEAEQALSSWKANRRDKPLPDDFAL
jgi:hypothetical protein